MIEMLVVVTIVMVVGTFAVMVAGDSQTNLDRQTIAREFKISLERARYDSVKRNVSSCEDMSLVEIKSATSFVLRTDQNGDGLLSPESESRALNFADPPGVEIVYDIGTNFPITIRFDRKGLSSSGPCTSPTSAATPTTFCTLPCTSLSANEKNATVVYVSPTGTTAYLPGGSRVPSLTTPSMDLLDSSNQINPGLAVWDPTTPISTPTPSPSSSLEPSPITSPTPVPTDNPSPTPSPRFCLLGEQPAINLCICSPLQYLQASTGKCRAL